MFRRPYRFAITLDIVWLVLMQSLRAKREMVHCASMLVWGPDQLIYGLVPRLLLCPMHHRLPLLRAQIHPSSSHFGSFSMCFRTSADDPPVNPASTITFELSGEITVRSRAAGLLRNQLGTKMSAGLVRRLSWLNPLPASH